MKIIVTEEQIARVARILESDAPLLDNGTAKEFGDESEVGTSATLKDSEGNPKRGHDVYTDEVSKMLTNQTWFGSLRRRGF